MHGLGSWSPKVPEPLLLPLLRVVGLISADQTRGADNDANYPHQSFASERWNESKAGRHSKQAGTVTKHQCA